MFLLKPLRYGLKRSLQRQTKIWVMMLTLLASVALYCLTVGQAEVSYDSYASYPVYTTKDPQHPLSFFQTTTIECSGLSPRNRTCRMDRLCIMRDRLEVFALLPKNSSMKVPLVNLKGATVDDDRYWSPHVRHRLEDIQQIRWVHNQTLFVSMHYESKHFSHFIFNSLLGMYDILRTYNVSLSETTFFYPDLMRLYSPLEHLKALLSWSNGFQWPDDAQQAISLDWLHWQISSPSEVLCFADAIIGFGNTCPFSYCARQGQSRYAHEIRHILIQTSVIVEGHEIAFETLNLDNFQSIEQAAQILPFPDPAYSLHSAQDIIVVGFLNRQKSRRVVNMQELQDYFSVAFSNHSLSSRFKLELRKLDLDVPSITLLQTIHLFKNITILISPHGNGLGNALWMSTGSLVVSLNARWSDGDWWFHDPFMFLNRRFWNWECHSDSCVAFDAAQISECLRLYGFTVNDLFEEELNALHTHSRNDFFSQMDSRSQDQRRWSMKEKENIWACHISTTPRKADVNEVSERLLSEWIPEMLLFQNVTFTELCSAKEDQCCRGPNCHSAVERHFAPSWKEYYEVYKKPDTGL